MENGGSTGQTNIFQSSSSAIFTGRNLGTYVHKDYSTEAWMNAVLILLSYGKAALDPNNPYKTNPTQDGFVTYGGPKVIELINTAAAAALKACWYQKWMVHLRLRSENFGLLVQQQIVDDVHYHLNHDVIDSPALTGVFGLYGTYLLPQMYPEGSPNAMGRDFAGVHFRSDCFEGMLLGEKIALSVLKDEGYTNNENFKGYIVTKFDGKTVTVGKKVTVS